MNDTMAARFEPEIPIIETRRRMRLAIACAAFALSSCTLLPPSLRKGEAPAAAPVAEPATATPGAGFGPPPPGVRPATAAAQSPPAPVAETRLYKGTGQF